MMDEAMEVNRFRAARGATERELFLAMLVRAFNDTLCDTVGPREAEGFNHLVGMAIAEQVLASYLAVAGVSRLDLTATLDAMRDWKRRLGGDFTILERTDKRVVLVNGRCPFAGMIGDSGAMCRVASHVFGHMVAESQGYGRVTLSDTIARGSHGCRIVIDLEPDDHDGPGHSYYAKVGR